MKHFCFAFILFVSLCSARGLYAQSGTAVINDIYMDHTGMNGNSPITVHVDCNIENMQGQQAKVYVFFYKGDDPYKLSANSASSRNEYAKYCMSDGHVALQTRVTPRYQNSHYTDLEFSLPSYVLSLAKNDGQYNDYEPQSYSIMVVVYDARIGKFISSASLHSFYVSRQVEVCPGGPVCGMCFGTGRLGGSIYGGFCSACNGTGRCPMCKGTGQVYMTYTGSDKYQLAQSLRQQLNRSAQAAGYMAPQNGYQSGASAGYGNGVSSSSRSTRRVCPGCNGTGKGRRETVYGTDYTGGKVTYICPECNLTTPHSHRTPTCRVCYGKGYID